MGLITWGLSGIQFIGSVVVCEYEIRILSSSNALEVCDLSCIYTSILVHSRYSSQGSVIFPAAMTAFQHGDSPVSRVIGTVIGHISTVPVLARLFEGLGEFMDWFIRVVMSY